MGREIKNNSNANLIQRPRALLTSIECEAYSRACEVTIRCETSIVPKGKAHVRKRVIGSILVPVAILLGLPATAFAAQGGGQAHITSTPVNAVKSRMVIECKLPSVVRPTPGSSLASLCNSEGVKPLNVVYGPCGDSYMYVVNMNTGDEADFDSGGYSSLGPIVYGSTEIGWVNHHTGAKGTIPDGAVPLPQDPEAWENQVYKITGAGSVSADLSGNVELANGDVCAILNPTDTENIS